MNINDHPLMKEIAADVAKANKADADQRMVEQMEATQLRHEQGQYLNKQFQAALAEYEAKRLELHAVVGKVFMASQQYSRLTGQTPPEFPEAKFNQIHVPTLKPLGQWDLGSSFSTTQASVMGFFSNKGKWA